MSICKRLYHCWIIALPALLLSCWAEEPVTPEVEEVPLRFDSVRTALYPFWSKDGTRIFFFGNIFGIEGYQLYEVAPEGGEAKLLYGDSLWKHEPALSPDGKRIAYRAAITGLHLCCNHVWVVNADGSNARDLTPFYGNWRFLRWSPDSRYLLFYGSVLDSGEVNYQIVRAEVTTGKLKMLTRGRYSNMYPSYTSDGEKIVYLSGRVRNSWGGKVWVMNADGSDPRPIDTTSAASAAPRVHPIRNEVWFMWGLGGELGEGVYSLDLDSVELPASRSSFRYVYRYDFLDDLAWSPSGTLVSFAAATSTHTLDLCVSRADQVSVSPISSGFQVMLWPASWSPDGKAIIFCGRAPADSLDAFFQYHVPSGGLYRIPVSFH